MSEWRIILCCTATGVPTASSHERYVRRKACVSLVADLRDLRGTDQFPPDALPDVVRAHSRGSVGVRAALCAFCTDRNGTSRRGLAA